jgi:hypothetical protein
VLGPNLVEVEIATGKLEKYKSPGTDQISDEIIILYVLRYTNIFVLYGIRRNFHSSGRNLSVPSHKNGDKTNNYRGISLLSAAYKTLSDILLARLTPYTNIIIGDHQCGFRRNRSPMAHIFYIRKILEKNWKYNGTVHQLFTHFKMAYDSVKREVLYNILIEFGIPKKLVSLIKMCLHET